MKTFILLLVPGLAVALNMFLDGMLFQYYSKKCNYDCSKCELWDCPAHHCNRKRK